MILNFIHPEAYPHTHPHSEFTILEIVVFFAVVLALLFAAVKMYLRTRYSLSRKYGSNQK